MGNMECVEKTVSERAQTGKISVFTDDWEVDSTSESSRSGSQRAGGSVDEADGGKTECDRAVENAGSDEMGRVDEQK